MSDDIDGLVPVHDQHITQQSACRGEPARPPRIDTRWHPDGCTCRACRRPGRVVDSSRDAFRPVGAAPPFPWAGRVITMSREAYEDALPYAQAARELIDADMARLTETETWRTIIHGPADRPA